MIEEIFEFLDSHPAIKDRPLEREVGMPERTLYLHKSGNQPISKDWIWPMLIVLSRYGFKLYGWTLTFNNEDDMFLLEKKIDKEPEIIEHERGFEYLISYSRVHITCLADLQSFFAERA